MTAPPSFTRVAASLVLVSSLILGSETALAQATPDCSAYTDIVRSSSDTTTAIIPDRLLIDSNRAIICLVGALRGLAPSASETSLRPSVRSQLLSVTNALRAIISKLNADDASAGIASGNGPKLESFIKAFRQEDDLPVITVLTYGARSDNFDVRSNALLILANVIDNSTLCVPLDHLYDITLGTIDDSKSGKDRDYARRGRANLLAVVSVVAPWAYQENYRNIVAVKAYTALKVDRSDPDLAQTAKILDNLQARLDAQNAGGNLNDPLPDNLKKDCKAYKPRYAKADQFKY